MSINRFYSKWGNFFYAVFLTQCKPIGAVSRRLSGIAGTVVSVPGCCPVQRLQGTASAVGLGDLQRSLPTAVGLGVCDSCCCCRLAFPSPLASFVTAQRRCCSGQGHPAIQDWQNLSTSHLPGFGPRPPDPIHVRRSRMAGSKARPPAAAFRSLKDFGLSQHFHVILSIRAACLSSFRSAGSESSAARSIHPSQSRAVTAEQGCHRRAGLSPRPPQRCHNP